MTTPEPLWRAMDLAYDRSVAPDGEPMWESYHGYAAELRAIADAIPEEFYGAGGVRRWLLEEADRAEAGE